MVTDRRLPRLELSDVHRSPFDEAVIIIDGREEETITIECPNALDLADQLIRLVNALREARSPRPSRRRRSIPATHC
nr:hypothetical protein [uncultured Bradyrhizobium sp.]